MSLVVANWGFGVNSTAMIVEMVRRGEPLDLVIGSDTGGEKPETYAAIEIFRAWLRERGLGHVIVSKGTVKCDVSKRKKIIVPEGTTYSTLEEECLVNKGLPSIAYGWKTCSQKWKREPIAKYLREWGPVAEAWARGERVTQLLGYDVDEERRAKQQQTNRFTFRYPLIEWGWGREECVVAIEAAGLPVPPKSACFFCPSSTVPEIKKLRHEHPDLFARALAMEDNAQSGLTSVKGLGRRFAWRNVDAEPVSCMLIRFTPIMVMALAIHLITSSGLTFGARA